MWIPIDAIPFDEMWEDDRHWLPQAITGMRFDAWFVFNGEKMLSQRIEWRDNSCTKSES